VSLIARSNAACRMKTGHPQAALDRAIKLTLG
jgi:hypothetical protein